MAYKQNSASDGQGAIYTLAQNGTAQQNKQPVILTGKGSDMSAKDYTKRKGQKKTITQALVLRMIDIAKQEGRTNFVEQLWRTYHCQHNVYTSEGRLYGKYCKNRFCTACMGIRKAEMINTYYPILKEWKDAYMVTLTIKSIPKKLLHKTMRKCLEGLNRIIDKYEKRQARGKGKKLVGIRSLECNFNPDKKTYNPHLHFIVPDLETADILKAEWLALWTRRPTNTKWVSPKGQKVDKIWNLDNALIEVIKYGTKVFTDPTENKPLKNSTKLYARAFYNIIIAMQGIRLFGSFGFKLPKENKKNRQPSRVTINYQKWEYLPEFYDWVDTETGNPLTGYNISNELLNILINNIDIISE